ncbi:MAG: hypothetical protein ACE5KH_02080 [Candidatus Geothermarchaeales archaeon]
MKICGNRVWFTELSRSGGAAQIGFFDTLTSSITEFDVDTTGSGGTYGLVVDGDGNPWTTNPDEPKIYGFDMGSNAATTFATPTTPHHIALSPSGELWYTDSAGEIVRMTPDKLLKAPCEPSSPVPRFVYSVKYLCSFIEPLPNVFHWTEINVHNPSKAVSAHITKKFIVAGTQEEPVRREYRNSLTLRPNGAFEIDCDEIQLKLRSSTFSTLIYPYVSTPFKGFIEIESDQPLSVVAVYNKCTKQPRTDVFPRSEADVTVELDLDLDGSFEWEFDMSLVGVTAIKKDQQKLDASFQRGYIDTEIVAMKLSGEIVGARLLGDSFPLAELPFDLGVRIVQSPLFASTGKIYFFLDSRLQPLLPVNSFFNVFVQVHFDDPALTQQFGTLYNTKGVLMEAELTQIEPPDLPDEDGKNVYRSPEPAEPLISTVIGKVVARIKAHEHTPNPRPLPNPTQPKPHEKVLCEDSSIDVEYVDPVIRPPSEIIKEIEAIGGQLSFLVVPLLVDIRDEMIGIQLKLEDVLDFLGLFEFKLDVFIEFLTTDLEAKLDSLAADVTAVGAKLDDLVADVAEVEAKLEPGGAFYESVDNWFNTLNTNVLDIANTLRQRPAIESQLGIQLAKLDEITEDIMQIGSELEPFGLPPYTGLVISSIGLIAVIAVLIKLFRG